ncbi:helix-turn-helix domain-containing protein [Ruminococcaceae bacterium OttesenSCG-928-D13]|nr:helix-turn-helix domain-containing protein [Ruminococcaceae bacterium OttesenSCG-928-D13]
MGISERIYIEEALERGDKFIDIARFLEKDPTTISKEIRKHRVLKKRTNHERQIDCIKRDGCVLRHQCHEPGCDYYCARCKRYRCDRRCAEYQPKLCPKLQRAPYVCNGCPNRQVCRNNKYYCRVRHADEEYEQVLHESRSGIDLSPEELDRIDKLVSPLLKQGQSIAHIYAYHGDEIPCTQRTLYNYVDNCTEATFR